MKIVTSFLVILFLQLIQLLEARVVAGACILQEVKVSLNCNYIYVDFEVDEANLNVDTDPALERAKVHRLVAVMCSSMRVTSKLGEGLSLKSTLITSM